MQAGDLIFVRGKGIIPSLIRLFDKGQFSHVAIAVSNTHVMEAEWNTKLRIAPLNYDNYEIVTLPLTPLQRDLIVHGAIQLTGKWYGYLDILGILLKNRIRFSDPNAFICSEAVSTLLNGVGLTDIQGVVTPNELYKLIKGEF